MDAFRAAAQKLRQRIFGSMPRSRTTSRSLPGGEHTDSIVEGHWISLVTPSTWRTVGRLTW